MHCRQKQEQRSRVEQHRHDEDKPAHGLLAPIKVHEITRVRSAGYHGHRHGYCGWLSAFSANSRHWRAKSRHRSAMKASLARSASSSHF